MALHGLEQGQGAVQIVAVVGQGLLHRFAHGLQAGKVNHSVNFLLREHFLHGRPIGNICSICPDPVPGNGLNAVNNFRTAVDIIIRQNHLVALLQQLHGRVRADVAGAACQ